jgi:hypothetical protein
MGLANIIVANPPVGSCIDQETVDWVQSSIFLQQSQLEGSQRILKQVNAPGPDDRDVLWNRISNIGAPLGIYTYYNGAWRRYPMSPVGQRSFYTGPITGVFDPTSLVGLPGTEWDGWKIDLTFANLFPVIASDYDAQTGAWRTMVGGSEQQQGGFANVTLGFANVPLASTPGLSCFLHARANPGVGDFVLWGDQSAAGGLNEKVLIAPNPGNPAPQSFQILPPFVAMAQVVFVGISV